MPYHGNDARLKFLLVFAGFGAILLLLRLGRGVRQPTSRADGPQQPKDDLDIPPGAERVWKRRVVAVGDLHGDLQNAQTVLRMAGIIDEDANWSGRQDILVQTGDIVDRGTDTIALYRMFQKLRGQARSRHGDVISLLGNHEIMNAIGDWRYVTQEDIATFGGVRARQAALSEDGWLGQEWMANYSVSAKVPLSPGFDLDSDPFVAFSHGSLHPYLPLLTPFPSNPNDLATSLLKKALTKPMPPPYPPNPYPGLPETATPDEKELYGADGVVWWRGLATEESEEKVCQWAAQLKERLGVRRVVGGHTPNFEQIVSRCNGAVVIIDTGISKAYGGVLSALEIVYELFEMPKTELLQDISPLEDSVTKETAVQKIFGASSSNLKRKSLLEVETVTAMYLERQVRLDRRVRQVREM